jgi:hypothetical protein
LTKLILELDLIPATCWFSNVRTVLSKTQWTILSRQVRSQAYDICQICQSSKELPLHCHEMWEYDETLSVQKLVGMIALCKSCHQVKHFGLACLQGQTDKAFRHFVKINKLSRPVARAEIEKAFRVWEKRSQREWALDISKLRDYGVDISGIKKVA